ncbi:MAG: hypothetical protein EZS28_016420 [Streblomastix strix]|uniref:Uncharacterized protein n=1 Tax=Streblomastix strix TaxID=222440 RepID=A0A5J4W0A5_9EUKA|nr:MAG: hypothetical protein EZS28_016420 [Streblomastix strix]
MHIKLSQLIHLNCPARLNCKYRINFPNNQTTFELRSSVFKTLAFLINPFENDVQQFLITNHNILHHVGPLITTFAQNILLNMSNFPQFISETSQNSSESLIKSDNIQHHFTNIGATYLLRTLLIRNTNFITVVSSIPGLINSLIILSRFQRQKNYRQSEQNESLQPEQADLIRSESILSLGWVQYFGNLNIQLSLIKQYDYIHSVLLEGIGNCSGSFEENSRATINAVEGINWLFIILNEGRDWCDKNHELKKQVEEEIEIGGGIEDLETPMFLNSEMNDEDSKWEALQTKRIIVSYW